MQAGSRGRTGVEQHDLQVWKCGRVKTEGWLGGTVVQAGLGPTGAA